jgi:hypothetical protein
MSISGEHYPTVAAPRVGPKAVVVRPLLPAFIIVTTLAADELEGSHLWRAAGGGYF